MTTFDSQPSPCRLTFDTRLVLEPYSYQSGLVMSENVSCVPSVLYDGLASTIEAQNRPWLALGLSIPTIFLSRAFDTTFHEMGHANASTKAHQDFYFELAYRSQGMDQTAQVQTPYGLFGQLLLHPFYKGAQTVTTSRSGEAIPYVPEGTANFAGAGVNWQGGLAKATADKMDTGSFHLLDFPLYLSARGTPLYYAIRAKSVPGGADFGGLFYAYNDQGVSMSFDEVIGTSLAGLALSGTPYSYVHHMVTNENAFDPGEPVQPIELGPVRWPELNFYFTDTGPSVALSSSARLDEEEKVQIPFSLESTYKGKPAIEAEAGVDWQYKSWTFHESLLFGNRGTGNELSVDYQYKPWVFSAGFSYLDPDTLQGQRFAATEETNNLNGWLAVQMYLP